MKTQPPDDNNPSNPLMKAAALEIDRRYLRSGPSNEIEVLATLNFKKDTDFRGYTTSETGEQFTVVFGAAIKKATLEIVCSLEGQGDVGQSLKITGVPYVSELANEHTVSTDATYDFDRLRRAAIKISGDGEFSSKASGGVKLSAGNEKESSIKERETVKVVASEKRLNVNGTFAGNQIHWTVDPSSEIEGLSYLNGEVFATAETKLLSAAKVSWKSGPKSGALSIIGSVKVFMEDIDIFQVRIFDADGEECKAADIRKIPDAANKRLWAENIEKIKSRLIKQVIRKHLLNQGMNLQGAHLEICHANG